MFTRRRALLLVVGLALGSRTAAAQELEPRLYSNSPVGLNFLLVGYAFSVGGLSLGPELPIESADLQINAGVLAYARVLDLWGASGKIDVVVPYVKLQGTAIAEGERVERRVSGLGDARFRLSINFYGAPALSTKEFEAYHRDLVVGASVQVSAPIGDYDPSRLVNLGSHRWWIRSELGVSKALDPITLDITGEATFFTDNDDFFGGRTLAQAPIYAVQAHVSFELGGGAWAALSATYYVGGRATIDGQASPVELGNLRAGALLAVPVTRHHSIKLDASRGIVTRTGADFLIAGVAWQYRWGAGY
jgi:hypothetical protein